jgi:hypothetical protein
MGRRSTEATAAKASFRWLGIRDQSTTSRKVWFRCLRSLGIRPRRFYTTRHTFVAWALSEGANLKGLAEYGGTSVQMIEQSYCANDRAELRQVHPQGLPRASDGSPSKDAAKGPSWRQNRTPLGGFEKRARISYGILVEAGGIEPPSEFGLAYRESP